MANTDFATQFQTYFETLETPPKTFTRGQIVTGTIIAMKKGEMLVDVGGRTEGVVLGKEMKLDDEVLDKKVGDTIMCYVIKGENVLGQIELSVRRSGTARKWHDLQESRDNDKTIKVTVIEANTGGVIVSIGGGLRGFIPTSQLDNSRIYPVGGYGDKSSAQKELQNRLGDLIEEEIEVKVIEIDRQKNRVILSEKQVMSTEDAELRAKTLEATKVGDILDGEVTGIAPFGLFVNAQGLEGLVHLSEISWDKVANPADFFKVGDVVKVQVIGMQDSGKRIAYSIKRLKKDPWDSIIQEYKNGQVVSGEVTKVVDYGAFVRIDDKVNGLIHISEMSDKLVKNPHDLLKVGDNIDLKIISISREERHLGLSMKRLKDAGKKAEAESTKTETTDVSAKEEVDVEAEVKKEADAASSQESAETAKDSAESKTEEAPKAEAEAEAETKEAEADTKAKASKKTAKTAKVAPEMEALSELLDE